MTITKSTLKYWSIALSIVIGSSLILGLTFIVNAQNKVVVNETQTATGTTITVTTTNDELNTDSDCSLREAVQAANTETAVSGCDAGSGWDTIIIPSGMYTLSVTGNSDDTNATGDLDILDSVTIIGAGNSATTIDGNATDRVFHVDPTNLGVTLDLSDIAITNGSSDSGGAMRVSNGLTVIQNSDLHYNEADDSGGAIHIDNGSLQIFTSTIRYNSVISSVVGNGGGIYSDEAVVKLTNSTVSYNTAYDGAGIYANTGSVSLDATTVSHNVNTAAVSNTYGGGIYANSGHLWIGNNSEIAYHQTAKYGGGIYSGADALLTMQDSWLHHNESSGDGGGLYSATGGATIKNSVIEYNTANTDTGEGGGIYLEHDLILESSTLSHNAADEGGGIYQKHGTLVISNTTVFSNTANDDGGGVYQYGYGGTFAIRSIFEENTATDDGGAIYMYDEGGVYVEDSAFLNNRAGEGGAIMIYEESALNVERSTFSGNQATVDGGAIYLYDYAAAEIRNSTFSGNHADDQGGAIYIYWPTADIQFTTITNNSAGNEGGGIYTEDYVAPQNSIIAGNSADGSITHSNADCYIEDTFQSGGGNLFGENTGCEATRYDQTVPNGDVFTTVLEPLADNGGAELPDDTHPQTHALLTASPAIDAAADEFCLETDQRGSSRPQGNACDQGSFESDYSATVTSPTDHVITVDTTDDEINSDGDCSLREAIQAANTDTAVDNCAAGDGWDTIQLPSGTYTLTIAGTYEDNNATGDLDVKANLTIQGQDAATTIIDGNNLDRVIDLDEVVLRLTDITVTNGDSPSYGGCIQSTYGYITVLDSVISYCESSSYGGGIYSDEGTMRIKDTLITENYSNSENGGAYNYYGVATIENTRVISNSGFSYGGGVMSYVGMTRVTSSTILSNTVRSSSGGGGVNHSYGNLIIEEDTEIRYNESANYGGGVKAEEGAILIKDSFVTDNYAENDGGGIYTDDDSAWVINTLIADNRTEADGGGYYGGGYLQHNTIQSNEAIESGGSVTNRGGGLFVWGILENNLVSDNKAETGAGIYGRGMMLFNTEVSSNQSQENAGAGLYLFDGGGAYVVDSIISENTGYTGQNGSGIYVAPSKASLVLQGSIVQDNSGGENGGGIYSEGVVEMFNSTLSGNSAEMGGGIYITSTTLLLNYGTIANNSAISSDGGGLANNGASIVQNSIIAGNSANASSTDDNADCAAIEQITFAGYSLFGDGTGCSAAGQNDITAVSTEIFTSIIETLADNGGNNETHALYPSSPAINAGNALFCPESDQRGVSRPKGGGCDMGAYESERFTLAVTLDGDGTGTVTGLPSGIDCGVECSDSFADGTTVTLTATADTGSTFTGWSGGGCSGTGTCVVEMSEVVEVTAVFTQDEYLIYLPMIVNP